ncbi:MAG: hypothetical protein U1F43_26305 [Myxococcota bacterium]
MDGWEEDWETTHDEVLSRAIDRDEPGVEWEDYEQETDYTDLENCRHEIATAYIQAYECDDEFAEEYGECLPVYPGMY